MSPLGRAYRSPRLRSSRASAVLVARLRRAYRARRPATCRSLAHWLHDVEEGGAAVHARWSGMCAAHRRTMAHVGAQLRRTCRGRMRCLASCDFDGGALRRPAAAPVSLWRFRDGWSDFFYGLVRACPGQPVKFSGRYAISGPVLIDFGI
ncbi:hypothetical protein F511_24797 [Dorcoceras hygrometricum]|uniref:Uncharacterized protein n=1 Tax=Dorcoceras hygrometricum TaxID=472368 RepID=A0A2Z7CZ50_9LAMI|nr:hypothetical protein F511_24797 [Dorcoceras hygrometricum]